ncbi:hypothetical protein E2C01_038720 [Portunus trituberculatus]|uniref:Uncharacterized protein n=1 Tax=Portunus trituberculatus TaxID=210409 RepID=A0A5B7FHQ1_PORTR|nr:hypothetical protein [Portunus trituberculatus]
MQSDPELKTQLPIWLSNTVPGAHSNFALLVAYLLPPTHLWDLAPCHLGHISAGRWLQVGGRWWVALVRGELEK